jgi:hypothetical protein
VVRRAISLANAMIPLPLSLRVAIKAAVQNAINVARSVTLLASALPTVAVASVVRGRTALLVVVVVVVVVAASRPATLAVDTVRLEILCA